ncbi:metallophosphoesterase family protein [Tannockella kyphosi]|uniref:metallophosphoesterase family protein n=1 Tax=Tannockella kyphosi TaxID=2899121 RepID=UPI0020117AD7|nr:metallophosphoesterase [Tannockella kyphosi]
MKIMIVSDSHYLSKNELLSIMQSKQVDCYFHCGDIYMPYTPLPLSSCYVVRGNNDYTDSPQEIVTTIDGLTIYATHGHYYYVEYSKEELANKAKQMGASICFFGHTHVAFKEEINGVLCINPGSVSLPRGAFRVKTYAIMDTETFNVTFYSVETGEACDPFQEVEKHRFSFF